MALWSSQSNSPTPAAVVAALQLASVGERAAISPAVKVFRPQQHNVLAGLSEGVNDDTTSLQWAWNQAIAVGGAVDLGVGKYRITAPMPRPEIAISVFGVSPLQTWIYVDKSMSGDALSFRETWFPADGAFTQGATSRAPGQQRTGVTLENFSIFGDRTTTQVQNGIVFHDRNDNVRMRNVEVNFIRGHGIAVGGHQTASNDADKASFIRESQIDGCQTRWCGDSATGRAAFLVGSMTRAAQPNDDATNYLQVRACKSIYADGMGLEVVNHDKNSRSGAGLYVECIVDGTRGQSADKPAVKIKGGWTFSTFDVTCNDNEDGVSAWSVIVEEGAYNARKMQDCTLRVVTGNNERGVWIKSSSRNKVVFETATSSVTDLKVDSLAAPITVEHVSGANGANELKMDIAQGAASNVRMLRHDEAVGRIYRGLVPSALDWDYTWCQVAQPTVTYDRSGRGVASLGLTAEALFDAVSTARAAPAATYYVTSAGNDTTGTGAQGAPFRSIWKAVATANAGGVPAKIIVTGYGVVSDAYPRSVNPVYGSGSPVYPTVDLAILADGIVCTGAWDPLTTGVTADGTHTNAYSVAQANAERVVDIAATDRYGMPVELQYLTTAARVNITPGSWTIDSGRILVNRADGKAPSQTNTRIFRQSAKTFSIRSRVNVYIGPATARSRWVLMGGGTGGGPFEVTITGAASTPNVIVAKNVTSLFGGAAYDAQSSASGRGFSLEGLYGTAWLENCSWHGAATDGVNAHNVAAVSRMQVVTLNCSGTDTGRPGFVSCNHLTAHEANIRWIDAGGDYRDSHGGLVRNIDTSRMYTVGSRFAADAGDLFAGGTVMPTLLAAHGTSTIWAESATLVGPAGSVGYSADSGAALYRRNCEPTALLDEGSTIATVAGAW